MANSFVHPYIPNSVPAIQREMLNAIGASDIDDLYQEIPNELKLSRPMSLPQPIVSECELMRHMDGIVKRNVSCGDAISFLGGGCARHYVPAICDEINCRSEFLTAYAGEPYEDHGRFQALFEYCSLMGELLDCDVVNVPTYDWNQAASTSIRMAGRITKRTKVLVAGNIHPDRLSTIRNYCRSALRVELIDVCKKSGLIKLDDLMRKIDQETAAVYFETPTFFGSVEHRGGDIARLAHGQGALCVVGADPISLGILAAPSHYGADITCGDLQSLGLHMHYGGAAAGFIATRDEECFVREYPSRLFGIAKTSVPGEWGFGDVLYDDRTSFGAREKGKEFVGTAAALWGITAGVYLALMGPRGMKEVGETIIRNAAYARARLAEIPGINMPFQDSSHFKEFVVDYSDTGRTAWRINLELRNYGIFGGAAVQVAGYPDGNCALLCVTEMHTFDDIEKLADSLQRIIAK